MTQKWKSFLESYHFYRIYLDFNPDMEKWTPKPSSSLQDFLLWNKFRIKDYSAGLCRGEDGREYRIGKVLNMLGRPDLLRDYENSKSNTLKDVGKLKIVISRHPYDIAGQSTDRRWTSCHDLENDLGWGGAYNYQMKWDMKKGIITAYVIKENDKNIKDPIARANILCYDYMHIEPIYGIRVPGFYEALQNFCFKFLSKL